MSILKIVFVAALNLNPAFAALPPPPLAKIESLKSWREFTQLIRGRDIKSVDQLVANLPKDFIGGFSLIYNTRALGRDLVSPSRPRVVVYGTDAKFILTYNSHPSGGYAQHGDVETVETIEFTDEGAYLREIDFDGINSPLAKKIEVNASRCTQCHGQDPKGLWDPYNHWAGVYGSLSRGDVDFIRISAGDKKIPEYENFMSFLNERQSNPRYSSLPLKVQTLSQLNEEMKSAGTPLYRPFLPEKMVDALVIRDGHTYYTNQRLGFYIGEHNFKRLGRMLANLPAAQRAAYQYLFKGIALDEKFYDLYSDKKFQCLPQIDTFFPESIFDRGGWRFKDFQDYVVSQQQLEYNMSKSVVEQSNLGLSIKGAGFSNVDPFDLDASGRDIIYDSISPPLKFQEKFGMTGSSAIMYAFYMMGLPFDQLSTAGNGTRYNLYYGSSPVCYLETGELPDPNCFIEDIEAFVTRFVPARFFTDSKIDKMSCAELAVKSRKAIGAYLGKN